MTEPNFSLETANVPLPIKAKLEELTRNIQFTKRSRKGSNGWLFFGTNRISNELIAIKFYDWGGDSKYHAEPKNLAAISSENVIQVRDASLVDNDYAYFLTPFYERGDLDGEICNGVRGNIRAISITRNILSGLSVLHSHSLLHRDLKAENILIADDSRAVIGDFGSVKKLPDGNSTVPGSGHSLICTPPESASNGHYGKPGDIYQVGIVLFQTLGGHFPYNEFEWLGSRELKKYHRIGDEIDRQLFAKECIIKRITKRGVVDIATLPPWVCRLLRSTVSKACNIDPSKRFQSCSEFLGKLSRIREMINDWRIEEGCPIRYGSPKYRVVFDNKKSHHFVQKDAGSGWRRDNSFQGDRVEDLVHEIEGNH